MRIGKAARDRPRGPGRTLDEVRDFVARHDEVPNDLRVRVRKAFRDGQRAAAAGDRHVRPGQS